MAAKHWQHICTECTLAIEKRKTDINMQFGLEIKSHGDIMNQAQILEGLHVCGQ